MLQEAWETACFAVDVRPFHPEAFVLLARIALAAGDGETARTCAAHAFQLVPGYTPAHELLHPPTQHSRSPEWIFLPAALHRSPQGPGLRLSVCLIARNEERFLARCLGSIRDLAHQIIVVDTGSDDRSMDIAREYDAEVHPCPWTDHFGDARNVSLEYARGDWVLVLDADEELPPEQHAALKAMMEQATVLSWRLPIQDSGKESEGCNYVPRLFRNTPGAFFLGRVHEQAFTSLESTRREWGMECRLGNATLRHHGYSAEVTRSRDKIGRNLRLLERALAEQPGDVGLLMSHGLELARSDRLDEALREYRAAFRALSEQRPSEVVPEVRETLLSQFAARLMTARRFAEIVEVLNSPLARSEGLTASLHFVHGLASMELRDFAEGAKQMQACLDQRFQPSLSPVSAQVRGAAPVHCLARCLWEIGEIAGAAREFARAIEMDPESIPVQLDHARFLQAQGQSTEALHRMHDLAHRYPTALGPWLVGGRIALGQSDFLEVALDWTAAAQVRFPAEPTVLDQRAEALLLAGRFEEALVLWTRTEVRLRPSARAAAVLCHCGLGGTPPALAPKEQGEVSREFLRWYRRLLDFGAENLVRRLGDTVSILEPILPEAARVIRAVTSAATPDIAVRS